MLHGNRLVLVSVLLAAACGGGTGPSTPPAAFAVVAGQDQTGRVASQLPGVIVVRVTDELGAPVAGQPVSFVPLGGGAMFAGFSLTNAAGEVRDYWTLGTVAGPQRLEARAVDPTTGVQQVFDVVNAQATPSTVISLIIDGQISITRSVGDSVDLRPYITRATDGYDNLVTDYRLFTQSAVVSGTQPFDVVPISEWRESPWIIITVVGDQLAFGRVDAGTGFIHVIGQ